MDWLHFDHTQQFNQLPDGKDVVIIEIDDKSLNSLGHWPWPRTHHAMLLARLKQTKAKAIVFDVLFPNADTNHPGSDAVFAKAIADQKNVILPLYFERTGPQGLVVESPPYSPFYQAAAAIGHIHYETAADGVVRAITLKQGVNRAFWPHLVLAVQQYLNPENASGIPGERAPATLTGTSDISIAKDFYNLLPMPSAHQGLRHFSYSDVLQGKTDMALLHNKVVFIGATATGLGDVLATPLGSMHGVELNAWTFIALANQQLIQTSNTITAAALTFITVFLLVLILGRLSPKAFLIYSVLSIGGIATISALLLLHLSLWMPPSGAIIGIALFFPLWSWLRAESMLHYLRNEVTRLALRPQPRHTNGTQAIEFLRKLELIEADTLNTADTGVQCIRQLAPQLNNAKALEGFWREKLPLDDKRNALQSNTSKGSDPITQTLAQLSAAQEQDQKNRRLIEESLSGLQDAVCIADLCGQITYTNHHFKQWFIERQPLNHNPHLLSILESLRLKSGKNWQQALKDLYLNGESFYGEAEYRQSEQAADDSQRQFLCQISLAQADKAGPDTLIIAFTDISKLKAAENARSEALSFLSHDLRSPMVSVLAIMERHRNAEGGVSIQDLNNIEALVRKNLDYAEAFLQLSKAETLPESKLYPSDLHAVLDAAHVHALALASPKSISVHSERCKEDAWVCGDNSLLERALNNLISNAIKFSPDHGKLMLSLSRNASEVILSVSDQGPGIRQEDQATLFTRFTRQHNAGSHGIGLGLNFVAAVVNKHRGKVAVQSEFGKGATFRMHFPAMSERAVEDFLSSD